MIKINKFLAASVVTLSLAACDLAPYSSIAVYADQAAKVVCDERLGSGEKRTGNRV